jgi:hypothetical protein
MSLIEFAKLDQHYLIQQRRAWWVGGILKKENGCALCPTLYKILVLE